MFQWSFDKYTVLYLTMIRAKESGRIIKLSRYLIIPKLKYPQAAVMNILFLDQKRPKIVAGILVGRKLNHGCFHRPQQMFVERIRLVIQIKVKPKIIESAHEIILTICELHAMIFVVHNLNVF